MSCESQACRRPSPAAPALGLCVLAPSSLKNTLEGFPLQLFILKKKKQKCVDIGSLHVIHYSKCNFNQVDMKAS